jgi:hypothetical protein
MGTGNLKYLSVVSRQFSTPRLAQTLTDLPSLLEHALKCKLETVCAIRHVVLAWLLSLESIIPFPRLLSPAISIQLLATGIRYEMARGISDPMHGQKQLDKLSAL